MEHAPMPTRLRRHVRPFVWITITAAAVAIVALAVTGITAAIGGLGSGTHQVTAFPAAHRPSPPATTRTPVRPPTCEVRFMGTGIHTPPEHQQIGALYAGLPIPTRRGDVFAGWYRTAADAASVTQTARVNGAQVVDCPSGSETLDGAWMTAAAVAAEKVRVPVLMYHQFTTKPEGEHNWLKANFDYIGAFEQNMAYLARKQFYFPTWDEMNAFIDGRLYLPHRSVVVTDDDADPTWENLAVPIVTKYKILATSFVITKYRHAPAPSVYVLQRSHTNDMHSAGADGKGKMVNYTLPQIVADLTTSVQVLGGVKEAFAYPFGQYNATAEEGLRHVGFWMAFTTRPGDVHAGSTKLQLPRERMSYGMTMQQFIDVVG
jgi:uncharacterized repeat protein (TIGR02543 family)